MIYLNVFFYIVLLLQQEGDFPHSDCITHSYAIIIHRVSILEAKTTQSRPHIWVLIMT